MLYDNLKGINSDSFIISNNLYHVKLNAGTNLIGFLNKSNALINLSAAYPTLDTHVATKKYVDDHAGTGGAGATFIRKQEMFVTTEGQTSFILTSGSYTPNTHTMEWYVNGVKQMDVGITETSSTQVDIGTILPTGSVVILEWLELTNLEPYPVHASQHLTGGIDPIPEATSSASGLLSSADKVSIGSAVQSATIGGAEVTKSGTQLQLPAYPVIPTAIKNPNALTFTGAISDSYDGSTAKSVAIPSMPDVSVYPQIKTGLFADRLATPANKMIYLATDKAIGDADRYTIYDVEIKQVYEYFGVPTVNQAKTIAGSYYTGTNSFPCIMKYYDNTTYYAFYTSAPLTLVLATNYYLKMQAAGDIIMLRSSDNVT
jgi:hypothetical protein